MTALNVTPPRLALLRAIAAGKVRQSLDRWWYGYGPPVHSTTHGWLKVQGLATAGNADGRGGSLPVVLTDAGRAVLTDAEARA